MTPQFLYHKYQHLNVHIDRGQIREEKKPFKLRGLKSEETVLIREDRED